MSVCVFFVCVCVLFVRACLHSIADLILNDTRRKPNLDVVYELFADVIALALAANAVRQS